MSGISTSTDPWIYDPTRGIYYHAPSNTFAFPDPSKGGQWSYIAAADFQKASNSTSQSANGVGGSDKYERSEIIAGGSTEKEEGEVQDDVGWGGLMEPEELAKIEKAKKVVKDQRPSASSRPAANVSVERNTPYGGLSAYDDPNLYAYPSQLDAPEDGHKETPNHLLRLVVVSTKSPKLAIGQVAVIDTRESGVQIGRDRCEKGAPARIRLRELEVSKSHAVIYWGKSGDPHEGGNGEDNEGWWIVDLGSTHGTRVSSPEENASSSRPKRLSEPKHSSKPFPIEHSCTITIGTTTFEAHNHLSWPCDACKLKGDNELPLDDGENHDKEVKVQEDEGQVWEIDMNSQQKKSNREARRKVEMANLRETLLNRNHEKSSGIPDQDRAAREYVDRSAMRRQLHPRVPQSDHRATAANDSVTHSAPYPPAPVQNKFAESLLAKQGWQQGSGLGRDGAGRAEPIEVQKRVSKRGLGAAGALDDGDDGWRQKGKMRRFEEISRKS